MGVSLPLSMTNTTFLFWILRELETTKKDLVDRQQIVKLTMIQRFTQLLIAIYVAGLAAIMGEVYFKFSGERDEMWRYEWINEACWYSIFTVFLLAVMALLRPSDRSRLLAHLEELHDTDRQNSA